ncbi:hypothetical protein HRI_002225100 [Hibiscus trionum]|nr:hypothetical protein HRI_002225100 [Hibiscus trionum]
MEGSSLSVRKGAWTEEEDTLLKKCIEQYGEGTWHQVPSRAGLNRCRKSCRLRWLNYLNPNIKRGAFAADEVDLIIRLHNLLGNRWSLIAGRLPGRTSNDVKNYWNNHLLKKKVNPSGTDSNPKPHPNPPKSNTKVIRPRPHVLSKNVFSISSDGIKGNNTTTVATTPASNNFVSTDNNSNENEEIMWWEKMLMNENGVDDQQPGSANDINLCVLGNQFMNEELGVVEEDNYGNLEELFLDVEFWNVFTP